MRLQQLRKAKYSILASKEKEGFFFSQRVIPTCTINCVNLTVLLYLALNLEAFVKNVNFWKNSAWNSFLMISITFLLFHLPRYICMYIYKQYIYVGTFDTSCNSAQYSFQNRALYLRVMGWTNTALVWYSEFHVGGCPNIFSQVCFTNGRLQYNGFLQYNWCQSFMPCLERVPLFWCLHFHISSIYCSVSYFLGM